MREVYLLRHPDRGIQTLGALVAPDGREIFVCKTLELPWKNNEQQVSSIGVGSFLCKYTKSTRLSMLARTDVYTYELVDVPGRTGIRIHSANYFFQLKGCIALGAAHKDINLDTHLDVVHSGTTVSNFNAIMKGEDFRLTIKLLST
jgi:hypothetical protein